MVGCVMGMRLWIVSRGSLRTEAKRRMGAQSESLDSSRLYTDFFGLRRVVYLEARRRSFGNVEIL
jgi:hypothetical protein